MSVELYAFIQRSDVPGQKEWQTSLNALEVPMLLDPKLQPFSDSGYSPCTLLGQGSGFEIYFAKSVGYLTEFLNLNVGNRDTVIAFRWGGDLFECACAMGASLALASSHNAIVYYPDDDLVYSVDELKRGTFALLEELN